jgi:hypothetical protein
MLVCFLGQTVFDVPDKSNAAFQRIFYQGELAALIKERNLEHNFPPGLIDCLSQALRPANGRPSIEQLLAHPVFQGIDTAAVMEERRFAQPFQSQVNSVQNDLEVAVMRYVCMCACNREREGEREKACVCLCVQLCSARAFERSIFSTTKHLYPFSLNSQTDFEEYESSS